MSRNREFRTEILSLPDRSYTDPVTYDAPDRMLPVLIGSESGATVSDHYGGSGDEFSAADRVQIDLGEDAEDPDHLISPQERLRVAMARQ